MNSRVYREPFFPWKGSRPVKAVPKDLKDTDASLETRHSAARHTGLGCGLSGRSETAFDFTLSGAEERRLSPLPPTKPSELERWLVLHATMASLPIASLHMEFSSLTMAQLGTEQVPFFCEWQNCFSKVQQIEC